MRNLKKVNKILISTLLVFSIGVFANYSKTASKYLISDSSDRITNSISFKSISRNFPPQYTDPGEDVVFTVPFYRIAADGDTSVKQDIITFETNEACTIEEVTGFIKNGSKNSYKIDKNKVTFTYKDVVSNSIDDIVRDEDGNPKLDENGNITFKDVPSNKYVKIVYRCQAKDILAKNDKGEDVLETTYKAYETIDNEETFRYFGGTYRTDKYIPPVPYIISDDKTKITIKDKNNPLTQQMLNDFITQFVNEYYKSINTDNFAVDTLASYLTLSILVDSNKANSIDGISYDADKHEYTLDETAISYAFTNFNKSNPKRLYYFNADKVFPTTGKKELTKAQVDSMFTIYYDKYYRPTFTDDENTYVTKYITDNGGASSVVVDGKKVYGLVFSSNYLTINKYVINAQLNETFDPITEPNNDITVFMQGVAGRVGYYVTNVMGVSDFDKESIVHNRALRKFFNDNLYNDTNMNTYFYIPINENLLSLRVYYDGGSYMMHMDVCGPNYAFDKSAQYHIFTVADKRHKTISDKTDDYYVKLKANFGSYVDHLDAAYNLAFRANKATTRFNSIVSTLTNQVTLGDTNITMETEAWGVKYTDGAVERVLDVSYSQLPTWNEGTITVWYTPTDDVKGTTSTTNNSTTTTSTTKVN